MLSDEQHMPLFANKESIIHRTVLAASRLRFVLIHKKGIQDYLSDEKTKGMKWSIVISMSSAFDEVPVLMRILHKYSSTVR